MFGPNPLLLLMLASLGFAVAAAGPQSYNLTDLCVVIAGKKWVAPADVRACFESFPVDPAIKSNTIEVINKTLAFHTSVNFEVLAPAPFDGDVHEDLLGDLARISGQEYKSDFDLHIDLSSSVRRADDGHLAFINRCYDSSFNSFLPIPLVLITDANYYQSIHIAPEAFAVASAEFADQIEFWQNALPGSLQGQLESLNSARVLQINGQDPWVAVNNNAALTGTFQGFGTRQAAFFSSYNRAQTGWSYILGNFALQTLPFDDSVTLTVQRVNQSVYETFTIPYRARVGSATQNFTDSASFRANNCVPVAGTNGADINASPAVPPDADTLRQQPPMSPTDARKYAYNTLLDSSPPSNVILPLTLQPTLPTVNGSSGVAQFFMLQDGKTGVLALGSFAATSFADLQDGLLTGLQGLKNSGAQKLIVDLTGNGGGFVCIAHWLYRIIIGPSPKTEPQAGLDTTARDGPLAQLILKAIIANKSIDPNFTLSYSPVQFSDANNVDFTPDTDWLQPPVLQTINGRPDAFSQRLGDECQPFTATPPTEALFDPKNIAIVGNGRCASSCALFSIRMAKSEHVKTVVFGGKLDVPAQYCGTVGGQSLDFSTIDTDIKTTHLKDNALAPPDFLTHSIQGFNFRLGFGVDDKQAPEEWQNHPADVNMGVTLETVNNPVAIWNQVASTILV